MNEHDGWMKEALGVTVDRAQDETDDSEGPPTSMRLPEPGEKPAAVKPKSPDKPKVISFNEREEESNKGTGVIRGDPRAFKNEVLNAMRHLSDRALIRADGYTLEVLNACLDFQKYARPKIQEIKEAKEKAGELAGALLNGVLGVAAGMAVGKIAAKLGEKLGEELAKQISEKLADGLKEQLVGQVKSMNKGSDDLEEAVDTIAQGFRFYASAVKKSVEEKVGSFASDMEAKVTKGLSNAETAVVTSFIDMNDEAMDALLERSFGIPGMGRSREMHVKIYRDMIKEFEKIHLRALSALDHDEVGKSRAFSEAFGVADREAGKLSEKMRQEETAHRK